MLFRSADFLHDTAASRQSLLRELFGFGLYEQIGREARLRHAKASERADTLQAQLGEAGDLSDEHLAALEAEVGRWRDAQRVVEAAVAEIAALQQSATQVGTQAVLVDQRLRLLAGVRVPDGIAALDGDLTLATSALAKATAARESARTALDVARRAVEDGPSSVEATGLLAAYSRLQQLQEWVSAEQPILTHLQDVQARAAAAAQQARQRVADARDAAEQLLAEARAAGELQGLQRLTGGATKQTWAFDWVHAGAREPCILQLLDQELGEGGASEMHGGAPGRNLVVVVEVRVPWP